MSREVYTVQWRKDVKRWVCPQFGTSTVSSKKPFIKALATKLARRWQFAHVPCQLKVFGKNGRIQFERTYGHDPKRRPG